MRLENSFDVQRPVQTTWQILQDVPAIAPCVPGVRLTEVIDDRMFRGVGEVRLGPVQLALKGEVRLEELDPAARTMKIRGAGRDSKGRGGAQLDVRDKHHPRSDPSRSTGERAVSSMGSQ